MATESVAQDALRTGDVLDLQVQAEQLEDRLKLLNWAICGYEVWAGASSKGTEQSELRPMIRHLDELIKQAAQLADGLAGLTKTVAHAEDAAAAVTT